MLVTILLLTAAALVLSLCFTPLVRVLAIQCKLVDAPDNKRKIHKKPIPRVGGVAVVAAYFGACLILVALRASYPGLASPAFGAVKSIAPAVILMFLTGLADDLFTLKPWQKLIGQIAAAALVVSSGIRIQEIAGFSVHPVLGILGGIAWLVLATNAVNLIDGVDGLASGITLFGTATVLVASLVSGNFELTIAAAPLAGALIGFLVFNFNPASIFLGDCGSLVLGFLLGCFGLIWSEHSTTIFGTVAPLVAFAVPLLDTTIAITRRYLRIRPIFEPDRSHIHHRLLARGLSQRHTVLFLYLAAALAGALALSLDGARHPWEAVVLIAFGSAVAFGIRQLGYAEFDAAGRLLVNGGFRHEINAQLALKTFQETLAATTTAAECWSAIDRSAAEFGLHALRMQLAGHVFGYQNANHHMQSWALRIPVSETDWVELYHDFTLAGHSSAVVPFVQVIRKVLAEKSVTLTRLDKQILVFPAASYGVTAKIS